MKSKGYRDGGQSDFLLLLVLDHKNKTIRQLQIDRDTMTFRSTFSACLATTRVRASCRFVFPTATAWIKPGTMPKFARGG